MRKPIKLSYLIMLKSLFPIKELTPTAKIVFSVLLTFDIRNLYKEADGSIKISIHELAYYSNCSSKTVTNAIKCLINEKFIEKIPSQKKNGMNSYKVIAISEEEKQQIREEDAKCSDQQQEILF